MNTFTILQFHMSKEHADLINAIGWDKASDLMPEIKIHREVKFEGSDEFLSWMSEYYVAVARVEGAKDLEDVFHAGNGYGDCKVTRIGSRMHSCSVGDIIRDDTLGTFYMVDPEGFTQLLSFTNPAYAKIA